MRIKDAVSLRCAIIKGVYKQSVGRQEIPAGELCLRESCLLNRAKHKLLNGV